MEFAGSAVVVTDLGTLRLPAAARRTARENMAAGTRANENAQREQQHESDEEFQTRVSQYLLRSSRESAREANETT